MQTEEEGTLTAVEWNNSHLLDGDAAEAVPKVSGTGVIITAFQRAGEIETGSFAWSNTPA
jgi:hypothetical protein